MVDSSSSQKSSNLSVLLQLEKKARSAKSQSALLFLIVNETINLVGYRQAFVWSEYGNGIAAVSGVPSPDPNAPYLQWAKGVSKQLNQTEEKKPQIVDVDTLPDRFHTSWDEFLAPYALWVPLYHPDERYIGAVLLARNTPFSDSEKTLLAHLAETYAHAWAAIQKNRKIVGERWGVFQGAKGILLSIAIILLALYFVPVQLTALGDAEVMPKNPAVIRSPLEGVIDQVLVSPNEQVRAGQTLLELDQRALSSRLLQAKKSREVEKVKLLKAKQMALRDRQFSSQMAIIQAMIEEQEAEVNYLEKMLVLATLTSPISGVAIFNDKTELIGKPIRIGEKIMSIAGKTDSHLVFWLATSDAIHLEKDARIRLFLNTSPNQPIEASLVSIGFTPSPRPEGYMAYRLEAKFSDPLHSPRIGLRGVAKIYGQNTSLGYLLFRRPLTALRQWTGL